MPMYLITYHGGEGIPSSREARQQAMEAFAVWAGTVGDAMVDPGAPLSAIKTVSEGSVTDRPAREPISGYTLLQADELNAAVRLVENHPFIGRGGSLQVSEAAVLRE
jgi:hypothetical protein